jgi:hypothetical protein
VHLAPASCVVESRRTSRLVEVIKRPIRKEPSIQATAMVQFSRGAAGVLASDRVGDDDG